MPVPREITDAGANQLIRGPYKSTGTLLVAQLVEALHYKPEDRGFD